MKSDNYIVISYTYSFGREVALKGSFEYCKEFVDKYQIRLGSMCNKYRIEPARSRET